MALIEAEKAAKRSEETRLSRERLHVTNRITFDAAMAKCEPVNDTAEFDERILSERLHDWGVGKLFLDVRLDRLPDWLPDGYRRMARHLLTMLKKPQTMALCGDRGRGKSALACGLVRAFCEKEMYARYLTANGFFNQISRDMQSELAKLTKLHLLVIDEVQSRSPPPWLEPQLAEIIDARYADSRPTLLLSCLPPAELQSNLGDSIHRRIIEQGGYLEADWPRIAEVRPV
jgi:DNA replication protein DnaC